MRAERGNPVGVRPWQRGLVSRPRGKPSVRTRGRPSQGSGEITSNVAGVAQEAESTSRDASDSQKASQQLVETSAELRRLVEQFKINNGESRGASGEATTRTRSMQAAAGA